MIRLTEKELRYIIKNVLNEALNELSPQLLQRASDKADELGRYSQAANLQNGANQYATEDFQTKKEQIEVISPRHIIIRQDNGDLYGISRDGSYWYRPRSGYNNEHGWLKGMTRFPDYMMVTDKLVARYIVKWWSMYYVGDKEVPFMMDWHNLVRL